MTKAPDLALPVTGWRVWSVGSDDDGAPTLVSPVASSTWRAREATVATCRRGCPSPPSWECTCGLYATSHIDELLSTIVRDGAVLGCTALWGRVVEAAHGWRGERGYPLVLFVPGRPAALRRGQIALVRAGLRSPRPDLVRGEGAGERRVRALSDRYAVPVHALPATVSRVADPVSSARAEVVRHEAARGLASRRLGEDDARRRFSRMIEDLVAALDGRPPPGPPARPGPPPIVA